MDIYVYGSYKGSRRHRSQRTIIHLFLYREMHKQPKNYQILQILSKLK